MGNRTLSLAAALVPALATLSVTDARAGGFQITELCAKCQGYRNAGAAASSREPATVFFNPAGIAFLPFTVDKKNLIDISAHYITGQFKFSDKDSRKSVLIVDPSTGEREPAEGKSSDDGGEDAPVPNFYYARKINERWGVGLAINTPYGLVTKYDSDWVGRYSSTKSDLITFNINPSVSFKFNDMFSLGFGLNAMYADAELKRAVDFGSIVTASRGAGIANFLGLSPSSLDSDGKSKLEGDDWGFGWNVGAVFNLNQGRTRLGISYRSNVETTLDGHLTTTFPDQLVGISPGAGEPAFEKKSKEEAKADLDLPATLNFGVSHDVNPKWTILAGATWTKWEDFEDITVKLDGGGRIVEPQNWDNSWRYQLGTEFRPNGKWAFRAGTEWDESPVPGRNRTSRVPDEDRLWLALGLSYTPWENLSVDLAYSHIFINDYDIDETEVLTEQAGALIGADSSSLEGGGNTLNGKYKAHANILSLGVRWRF